jgi:hypothetical protein
MPIKIPSGTTPMFRYKKGTTKDGKRLLLEGYGRKGKFIKVERVVKKILTSKGMRK